MAKGPTVVILAAGAGTRMRSALPKVLHPVAGRPMVAHVAATAEALKPARLVVVVGPGQEDVAASVAPHPIAIQALPRGTGDAVKAARAHLKDASEVLVLYGDTPLLTAATLRRLLAARRRRKAAVAVLGFRPADPSPYGRFVTDGGLLQRIVESRDANAEELKIGLCNAGVMAIEGSLALKLLDRLRNDNAKGEYYLTDLVALARKTGHDCAFIEGEVEELQGINSRAELAMAEAAMQKRLRLAAMENGATLQDPETVYFSADTRLGRDVTIGPNVVFGAGVAIADNVTIRGFCHIDGARIAAGATVGPFARLRPGTTLGEDVHIGNFVEVKASSLGKGAKANHLAYVGDASIGAKVNIGAGVITVNYDGFGKYRTEIGDNAFVGSNASLIAPVKVGAGAIVGAGSVIAHEVPAEAVAVERSAQSMREGGAPKLRARNKARAEAAKKKR
ncbi:MAG: glucosamine-phosphate N-acetyltransferase / UDP-N-acetylglucosamine pyrophosphorylase [Alphaproteobacteria bacterium]|jgi:bifunctional UDP-N-acetylglucosamine pyrophosphorylase/glucosamine-1-phosphate N-acetyltransferase|nr:glucosamine-phosphate N-acetyltransferase / UDP-N-acetylglucosamine pyrophosphorylase [Alphaproteobacteria bacterium]